MVQRGRLHILGFVHVFNRASSILSGIYYDKPVTIF